MSRQSLSFVALALGIALGLFVGMLTFLEVGRRFGIRQLERHGPDARIGVGVVDGAVYSLLALLVGFSFSGAAGRFDNRRLIVGREVNAIGTAWLRIDLLPDVSQVALRDSFRRYVDAVIASHTIPSLARDVLLESPELRHAENEVWSRAVAATLDRTGEQARMLLLPSLNEMFDVVTDERLARRIHPPLVIFVMLAIAALASSLFAGYGVASKSPRNWVLMIGVAATISMAAYVIIELEYPRLGLIRVSDMDRALAELRATMQ